MAEFGFELVHKKQGFEQKLGILLGNGVVPIRAYRVGVNVGIRRKPKCLEECVADLVEGHKEQLGV